MSLTSIGICKSTRPSCYNVRHSIIAGPKMLKAFVGCDRLAYWAHEIMLVHQYKTEGWNAFLGEYLAESPGGHCSISLRWRHSKLRGKSDAPAK